MQFRQWRLSSGLSRPEAAALLRVNLKSVYRYEDGRIPHPEVQLRAFRISDGAVQPNDWYAPLFEQAGIYPRKPVGACA